MKTKKIIKRKQESTTKTTEKADLSTNDELSVESMS